MIEGWLNTKFYFISCTKQEKFAFKGKKAFSSPIKNWASLNINNRRKIGRKSWWDFQFFASFHARKFIPTRLTHKIIPCVPQCVMMDEMVKNFTRDLPPKSHSTERCLSCTLLCWLQPFVPTRGTSSTFCRPENPTTRGCNERALFPSSLSSKSQRFAVRQQKRFNCIRRKRESEIKAARAAQSRAAEEPKLWIQKGGALHAQHVSASAYVTSITRTLSTHAHS